MMADEADPIVYFAQVAALAAVEEAREGMQAPLPPLWPRVLHLLADLKLPPDSTPGALIQLPVILRALRSSNEHLQTLGLGTTVRFTEDRTRAGESRWKPSRGSAGCFAARSHAHRFKL
jgi:hypothetical protein